MATLKFHAKTSATPEQFVAGLTDFGSGRSELFPNSADGDLELHSRAPLRPTSPKAPAESGSGCITTGPTPTTSS